MSKTILLTAMLLAMASSMQAENKLTASNVTVVKGEPSDLIISMDNDIEVGAYDFHLYLPEGVVLVFDAEEEDYVYELSSRHNKKHQLTVLYDETDGSFMCGVADPSLHKLQGNSGEVLRLQLAATADAVFGVYQGSIKKIWFAESGSSGVDVPDATFTVEITDAEVGIHDVYTDSSATAYYTLTGLRVVTPARGVYIRNGRKLMKK